MRLRVLATAYACEPGVGSEGGIGWNLLRQIAKRHDCWLITRENNVADVEDGARSEGLRGLRVHGFDLPHWARFWKRGGRAAMPYFYLWQLALSRFARRLDDEVDFDVVHHLTFASSWIPSGLAAIEKPFVWGPVGQHPRIPARFLPRTALGARCAEWAKALVRGTLLACDPFVRRTLGRADRLVSLGSEFGDRIPPRHWHKLVPMLAAGVEPRSLSEDRFRREDVFRVLFAGRLVDLKGPRLALDAFAYFARRLDGGVSFDVVGDGPLAGALSTRARKLGIEHLVRFHGARPHAETLECMRHTDVFLFPSFEGGGMVVPEAMAAGAPVVCLDFGGPGEMVGTDRGVRVPLERTWSATARGLGEALLRLAEDEERRASLARRAHRWSLAEASWDSKGERLSRIYEDAIDHWARGRERMEVAR